MFQFRAYASSKGYPLRDGLPHSDIHGSTLLCSSPWLFAALHVLHRLCMPRHPPCALFRFVYRTCTTRLSQDSPRTASRLFLWSRLASGYLWRMAHVCTTYWAKYHCWYLTTFYSLLVHHVKEPIGQASVWLNLLNNTKLPWHTLN